jgi:dolichol-phosphate mannosyltransferase
LPPREEQRSTSRAQPPVVPPGRSLAIVVPVHNEAENIDPLLAEIRRAVDTERVCEVIYVDDGSTDGTPCRLASAARAFPGLRVIRHARRSGQSAALWTGVRAARASWVVTLDGDGQNDPADIPRLTGVLDSPSRPPNLWLVAGIRATRRDRWLRRAASRIANAVRSRVLGDHVSDTGCGLKLLHREAFLSLPYFDHMHRFLPALVLRGGGAVVTVPVGHRGRRRGRSKYGVLDRLGVGLVDLLGVLWLKRRMSLPAVNEGEGP